MKAPWDRKSASDYNDNDVDEDEDDAYDPELDWIDDWAAKVKKEAKEEKGAGVE